MTLCSAGLAQENQGLLRKFQDENGELSRKWWHAQGNSVVETAYQVFPAEYGKYLSSVNSSGQIQTRIC